MSKKFQVDFRVDKGIQKTLDHESPPKNKELDTDTNTEEILYTREDGVKYNLSEYVKLYII